ncbi:hypothetical protein Ahy_A10g047486 isoform A [Arachis hypogaea]|uniref:Uncharacterized protein n=1 Tax=Arachis hypogaea TaxID=3818 RepID=A0A445B2P5_ARAHY|nr:hypothetical protein Ahy_A10g047486 isoform A [Arachis hypogaea]
MNRNDNTIFYFVIVVAMKVGTNHRTLRNLEAIAADAPTIGSIRAVVGGGVFETRIMSSGGAFEIFGGGALVAGRGIEAYTVGDGVAAIEIGFIIVEVGCWVGFKISVVLGWLIHEFGTRLGGMGLEFGHVLSKTDWCVPLFLVLTTSPTLLPSSGELISGKRKDRPSTKVHAAPGGGSSLNYLFGGPPPENK